MSVKILSHPGPLGALDIYSDGKALVGLYFPGHAPAPRLSGEKTAVGDKVHDVLRRQLDAYFTGARKSFDAPIALSGTAFQNRVWAALQRIAYGDTMSYAALAKIVDQPSGVRAVAGAVARNPISILVPCHRIIGADGGLTGYAGGLERKRTLLTIEGALL